MDGKQSKIGCARRALLLGIVISLVLLAIYLARAITYSPLIASMSQTPLTGRHPELLTTANSPGTSEDQVRSAVSLTPHPDRPEAGAPSPTPTIPLPTPDPWSGKERVNILVLGVDSSDWESADRAGPPRSDTMLVLTMDPVSMTAGMLSIPRDLWVDIPGMIRPNKINTAHRFGEIYRLPGGGPGLAMRTVEQLLGIPIHFYVRVDFRAFERFIDSIGGITMDVPYRIKIDPIGPNNTVVLKPGKRLLDGAQALGYARNRSTAGDDFDRSKRQEQVILAIRERVLSLDTLPLLVAKTPELYKDLSPGIQTNLTLTQAIQLAWLAKGIRSENIRTTTIGSNELIAEISDAGQTVYRPHRERIRILVTDLFGLSGTTSVPIPSLLERMQSEEASLAIIDASRVEGLADRTASKLESQGLLVTGISRAEKQAARNRLIDYTGKVYTVRYLAQYLGVSPAEIQSQFTPGSQVDVVVILGYEWAWNRNSK